MIDREAVRRAQMTITKLRHHFPRALPKLVSNVEDWLARTDLLFDLLKNAVHSGSPLLSEDVVRSGVLPKRWTDEVARIKRTHPSLASLMDAVTFSALSDLQPCQNHPIEWIEQQAESLSELCELEAENACELPMLLLSVRDSFPPTLSQTIVRCLTDPAMRQCRWETMDSGLNRLNDSLKKAGDQNEFSVPDPPSGETVSSLVRSILYQTASHRPKRRREVFDLLDQLLKPELLDDIADSQREVSSEERRLRRLLRRIESGHELIPKTKIERKAWLEKARGIHHIRPERIAAAKALGKALRGILNDRDANGKPWTRFLSVFPADHTGLAVRLMAKWKYDWYGSKEHRNDLQRVVDALSSLLHRRGVAAPLLDNWRDYVDGSNTYDEFVTDTCYEVEGKSKLARRAVRLLERTVYDLQLDLGPALMASLVEFAQATNDDSLSCSIIDPLSQNPDDTYVDAGIRIAILYGDSPGEMAQILVSLKEIGDLDELEKELSPLAGDPALQRMIAKRIIAGQIASLKPLTSVIGILNHLDRPLPAREVVSQPLDWCSRFPGDLRSALQSLSESTPDAERIAEKILGRFFPTREALQQQIDALLEKLDRGLPPGGDEARMYRRLDNLQRRLDEGGCVSPARQCALIEKLERRAEAETLQRYTGQCRQQVATAIGDRFGVQEFPEDLLASPLDRVLREITRLGKPMRHLGIRLLFQSAHRTTRSFDEEPKNLAFARRMESIGINLRPWLSDQLRLPAQMADGTPYELGFTREAIDILLMGFHFDTCLSPDSFNFFSTVANAVDLNKRVVYGKTEAGKVVGRCLFALNESGEILTYHRYSHDAQDGFADAVDRFAIRLAGEMQTCLGSGGQVAKLVANDWYDDGPVGGSLQWLGEGGIVGDLVKRVESDQLLPELIGAVGENVLRQRVVEVATSAYLRDRSEFLSALLDRFGSELSFRQRFTVAVNVEPANLSTRLLSHMRWSEIIRLVHRHQCNECDVFHGIAEYGRVFRVLTQFHPSLGLRAIRASRSSSIQNDLQDPNPTRRRALIEAHRQLGRQHLVERLSRK
ncbi:hypothetical protein [Stieleria mannarensis]|uniref:hypothetical protein n=1 Tax=Stieleria mannarensis TaxID=2755585 RepID=UPI002570DE18|nr:hypothetical protein [Rhodopirellula sp. JC639]